MAHMWRLARNRTLSTKTWNHRTIASARQNGHARRFGKMGTTMSKVRHLRFMSSVLVAVAITGTLAGANAASARGVFASAALLAMATINGTPGFDILNGTTQDDVINGLDDMDIIYGDGGADTIFGGNGPDLLYAGAGNTADKLYGEAGNDILYPSAGPNVLDGGDQLDMISYIHSPSAVTVKLIMGTGSGGDAQGDTLISIEGIAGSPHNDVLIGDNSMNQLTGQEGNDTINGGGGDDVIKGGPGNDILVGGEGADYFESSEGDDIYRYGLDGGSTSSAPDQILEFQIGNDKIALGFIQAGGAQVPVETVTPFSSLAGLNAATLAFNQVGYAVSGQDTHIRVGTTSFLLILKHYTSPLTKAHFVL